MQADAAPSVIGLCSNSERAYKPVAFGGAEGPGATGMRKTFASSLRAPRYLREYT